MSNRSGKHHWSSEGTRLLLQCAIAAHAKCGNNKKGVHKAIAEKYNEAAVEINTQRSNDFLQMIDENKVRHKYDSLKRDWVKWESLNNKTGAGWDPVRQTVSGNNEWWDDRVKEFGQIILKFKRAPIDHLELQQQLFQGTHATGRTSYTPASTQNEQPPQFTPSAPGSFANPWDFDRFQSQLHDVEEQTQNIPNLNSPANPFMHQEPIYENPVQQTPVQQSRNIGSSSGIRRKRRVDTEEKMDAIVDYIHDRQVKKSRTTTESPHTNSVHSTGSSLSYADLIARIKRLSE